MASSLLLLLLLSQLPALATAKSIWSGTPGTWDNGQFIMTSYPLGNGRLGAMHIGSYGKDIVNLNVDTLWRGGKFENTSYTGGDPLSPLFPALPGIRENIFQQGTGDVSALYCENYNYGSYQALANLTVDIGNVGAVQNYKRELDLESAVYMNTFSVGNVDYTRESFCSYPDNVCVYRISAESLPQVTIALENLLVPQALNVTCQGNSINLWGLTVPVIGLIYNARATVTVPGSKGDFCSNGQVVVPKGQSEVIIVIAADTDYDAANGNAAANYSFKGVDPTQNVTKTATTASQKSYSSLKNSHIKDYSALFSRFTLSLPDPKRSAKVDMGVLFTNYTQPGDPYVENLLFDYARYLFIGSSRPGTLPPNLQGLWAEQYSPAWSADYHANINIQMNHWTVEQTGLGDQTGPLWGYISETWMPRGAETAYLLYNATKGWTTHNQMNTFGYTAMMAAATWANYPVANAWMSLHVWDHFDYSQDVEWYRTVGYPILKGTAEFWLSQLVEDKYFNDGTWVANPCNSPEHGPTTFGCTHWQQMIWEVFTHVIRGWEASGDTDTSFKSAVSDMLSNIDPGLHIGSWGQIQEWKIDMDVQNDTHRHLSNLYGWYPGFYISSTHGFNTTVTNAVATTLYSRGNGVDDQDTGWGKMWRGACWALLNNTAEAYGELTLMIQNNIAANGFDMYSSSFLQIDANFGVTGNVMSMLIRDLDRASTDTRPQSVLLGPAIPAAWAGGSVQNVRLRGGGSVSFGWDSKGVVNECKLNSAGRVKGAPTLQFFVSGGAPIKCESVYIARS